MKVTAKYREQVRQKLMTRVRVDPGTGCWAYVETTAQGRIRPLNYAGRQLHPAVASIALTSDREPAVTDVVQLCGTPRCVNPLHLDVADRHLEVTSRLAVYREAVRGDGPRLELSADTIARFFSYIDRTEDHWLWTGGQSTSHYGRFFVKKTDGVTDVRYAHRVSYELHHRLLVGEETVDHLCRTPLCVNPVHLDACSMADNTRRAFARRTSCSQGHPYSGDNLILNSKGHRRCRTCVRAQRRAHAERGTS